MNVPNICTACCTLYSTNVALFPRNPFVQLPNQRLIGESVWEWRLSNISAQYFAIIIDVACLFAVPPYSITLRDRHTVPIFILQIFVKCLCSFGCTQHTFIHICTEINSDEKNTHTWNYSHIAVGAAENRRCKIECANGNVYLFVFQNCSKVKWLNQSLVMVVARAASSLNVYTDRTLIMVLLRVTYTHTNEPTKAPFTSVTPTKYLKPALIRANIVWRILANTQIYI